MDVRWIMLIYKIPREPTAGRVYVWRKLQQVGAIALQDAVWVLPATPRTKEQFQWLAAEIVELNGEASLFQSTSLSETEPTLQTRFNSRASEAYEKIMQELRRKKPDLPALSKKYMKAKELDFFDCELGIRVREKLLNLGGST